MFDEITDEEIVKEKLYGMEEHERWEFVKRFLNDDEIIEGILEIIGEDAVAEVAEDERQDWLEHMAIVETDNSNYHRYP